MFIKIDFFVYYVVLRKHKLPSMQMHLSHSVTLIKDVNWLRVHSREYDKGRDSPGLWGCDTEPAVVNTCPEIRLEMIITSFLRKRLGFGEAQKEHKELETYKMLHLLQSFQEIWKVRCFLIRFPQRSQLDRRQRLSHLGFHLCSGTKEKVGSYPLVSFGMNSGKFLRVCLYWPPAGT